MDILVKWEAAKLRVRHEVSYSAWTIGNALSQLIGITIRYTKNGNDSVSGESEWYASSRPNYRRVRDAVDWAFMKILRQPNHCFEALYNDYVHACRFKEKFERRYGKGVNYVRGGPVPTPIRECE